MYPVQYASEWVERHSRLSTFFRRLLVLPAAIFSALYLFAAEIVAFFAWFALLFTGRYPDGMYRFVAGALRNNARTSAYGFLLTDAYPPFDGHAETPYPITVQIDPPLAQYSRLKVFFRGLLIIPLWFVAFGFSLVAGIVVIAAWLAILFTGKMPEGIQELLDSCVRYLTRFSAYHLLLTETWPPLSDPDPAPGYGAPLTPTV
jgi:hypothetical protein